MYVAIKNSLKVGVAPVLIASFQPFNQWIKTCDHYRCMHANSFNSNYTHTHECDVALGWHCPCKCRINSLHLS